MVWVMCRIEDHLPDLLSRPGARFHPEGHGGYRVRQSPRVRTFFPDGLRKSLYTLYETDFIVHGHDGDEKHVLSE